MSDSLKNSGVTGEHSYEKEKIDADPTKQSDSCSLQVKLNSGFV
jgi:hypothetical protein